MESLSSDQFDSTNCIINKKNNSIKNSDFSQYSRHRYLLHNKRPDQMKDKKRRRKEARHSHLNGDFTRYLNKCKESRSHHTTSHKSHKPTSSSSQIRNNKSGFIMNGKIPYQTKLVNSSKNGILDHALKRIPILASIELMRDSKEDTSESTNNKKSTNEKVLFKDYVLIPATTKFKHLVYSVLEHANFPNKSDYGIIDGFLNIENWRPIPLDRISTIVQSPLNSLNCTSTSMSSPGTSPNNLSAKQLSEKQTNANSTATSSEETDNNNEPLDNNNNVNNNTSNNNHVNKKNSINNNNNDNENNASTNHNTTQRKSRPTSLNTSSSRMSSTSSTNSSQHSRTSSNHSRERSASSNSNSSRTSSYSEYEDNNNNDNSAIESELEDLNGNSKDGITVNDMLSQVISFATLSIKLSTNKSRCDMVHPKPSHQSHSVLNNIDNRDEDQATIMSPMPPAVVTPQQQQKKTTSTMSPQQHLFQNYLTSLQSKQQQQQTATSVSDSTTAGLLTSLVQNANLFNQKQTQQSTPLVTSSCTTATSNSTTSTAPEDAYKKFNELLLPMLMTQSAQAQQQQQQQPHNNFTQQMNNTNNNPNSQLASILPLLNLPIFSQLLNGIKGSTADLQPQQQLKSLLHDPLNLNSAAASTLSRLLKATASDGSDNCMGFDASSLLNQPLNLCKEMSQSSSASQQHTQFHGSNHRKSSIHNKSPPPLPFNSADRNPYLSVNVNGSNHANNLANNVTLNNIPNSIFNTSPSPSISSSSCSTSSSTEKTVNPHSQVINLPHLNNTGSKSSGIGSAFNSTTANSNHMSAPSHKSASYIINNRRQRERTTFDPQEEITRLMSIFERTHHPTRYQIASICDSLNSLACRRDKKPLEPYNIQYWFKNARAALRRKVKGEGDSTLPLSGQARSASSNAIKSEVDPIFNGQQQDATVHEAYVNSKYSNYDDEENELDEEYDDEYGHENDTGYSLDAESKQDVDLNNNHIEGMKLEDNHGHHHHKGVHKSHHQNNTTNNHSSEEQEHAEHDEEHSHLEHYENYNDENTLDDEEDNNYLNSTYEHGNNHLNDNEFNESFDEDNYKTNSLNSTKMSNKLVNAQKIPSKNLMSHNNNNSSIGNNSNSNNNNGSGVCNRRNRVFIDPISEVPILEHYFSIETYPDHYLIEKICENLNKGEYRFKFPKLESRNIQLWFKNHRAKLKRLKSTPTSSAMNSNNNISSNLNNSDDQMQAMSEMKADVESEQNFGTV